MRRGIPLLFLLFLAVVPATASADDADVKDAWNRHDKQFKQLGSQFTREARAFARRGYERPAAPLEVIEATSSMLRQNSRGVRAAEASTDTGRRAKRYALLSNSAFAANLRAYASGVRLLASGRRAKGNAALARGDRWTRKARRRAKKAKTLFRRAGVSAVAATDETVFKAWNRVEGAYVDLYDKYTRERRAFRRRDYERPGPLLKTLRRLLADSREHVASIRREEPDTELGERAKRLVLLALADSRREIRAEMRGFRLLAADEGARGKRWLAKAKRFGRRVAKYAKRARDAFAEAGVEG